MSEIIIATIITVSSVGIVAAVILYWASQKFKVFEDPRIDEVDEVLPAANCGGCGYPGCRNFAEACVKADTLDDLNCPVGGNDTMKAVAEVLGKEVTAKEKMIAVLRCHGSPTFRPRVNEYDGAGNCTVVSKLYAGDTDCQYGCLGHGDCVEVCDFDAIHINPISLLPEVTEANCTACNACIEACPKDLLELRPAGKKGRRVYVSCMNQDKGGAAKKACKVACIGCKRCEKVCPHDAIKTENFLAYIDPFACKLCRKCIVECPTDAIHETNFPPRKTKPAAAKSKTAVKKKPAAEKKASAKKTEELNLTKRAKEQSEEQKEQKKDKSKE